jgi:hypothetical protein
LVYPANDANAWGTSPPSYLDALGLLFGAGAIEINIWGNGGLSNYNFGGYNGGLQVNNGSGTFSLTEVVPEPASFAAWTLMGLCIAGWSWRRKR